MYKIKYNESYKSLRWVGHFDLLGTKKLINDNKAKEIFAVYKLSIEEFKDQSGKMEEIHSIWFSDTFILYSDDNSLNGYAELEHLARWFHYHLIKESIPVRGAISYGEFYCDQENNLFFGKPLIEAYEYGEAQDWLGLIICPSAEKKLKPLNIKADQNSAYIYTEVPAKKNLPDDAPKNINLPACILACWLPWNFQESFSQHLYKMMSCQEDRYKRKYQNTIDFLNNNKRYVHL